MDRGKLSWLLDNAEGGRNVSLVHVWSPSTINISVPVKPGITALPSFIFSGSPTLSYSKLEIGATTANRFGTGTNAQGKEFSDEKWLEVKTALGAWTPIGNDGFAGTKLDVTGESFFLARLNVPVGVSTSGDFVGNIEFFYTQS